MNRIFVFSDLHGNIDGLKMVLKRADEENCDLIICAGDIGLDRLGSQRDQIRNSRIPMILVRGNCDSAWTFPEAGFPIPPKYTIIEFFQRTVFVTHGDVITDWRAAPVPLSKKDIFISGHSHIAHLEQSSAGPIVLNPGSVSSPRDHRPPSYAVITADEISIKVLRSRRILKKLML